MTAPKKPPEVCKDCWVDTGGIEPKRGWLTARAPGPRCFVHRPATRPREVCKDCWVDLGGQEPKSGWRPATERGPRCVTHARVEKKRVRKANHGKRVESIFGITEDQYWALYEAQGGRCYICKTANGSARRLAVDHDHETGLVRGLLCGPDNLMIGRLRVLGLVNALEYLHNPPAIGVIGCQYVPLTDATGNASTSTPDGAKPTTTDGGEPDQPISEFAPSTGGPPSATEPPMNASSEHWVEQLSIDAFFATNPPTSGLTTEPIRPPLPAT